MIMNLYSVKDKLLGFAPPIPVDNDKAAIRWFESQMATRRETDKMDPKYWDLYKIGTFNSETGEVTGTKSHEIELIREGEMLNE